LKTNWPSFKGREPEGLITRGIQRNAGGACGRFYEEYIQYMDYPYMFVWLLIYVGIGYF
jgi:hypothetical protein